MQAGRIHTSYTYGTLPAFIAFEEAFDLNCPDGQFQFGNDKRVGNEALTCSQLWRELRAAQAEFVEIGCTDPNDADSAGDWCSSVLGILGFEWI